MGPMDSLDIILELGNREGIEVPGDDFVRMATLDGWAAYLDPRMRNLQPKSTSVCRHAS